MFVSFVSRSKASTREFSDLPSAQPTVVSLANFAERLTSLGNEAGERKKERPGKNCTGSVRATQLGRVHCIDRHFVFVSFLFRSCRPFAVVSFRFFIVGHGWAKFRQENRPRTVSLGRAIMASSLLGKFPFVFLSILISDPLLGRLMLSFCAIVQAIILAARICIQFKYLPPRALESSLSKKRFPAKKTGLRRFARFCETATTSQRRRRGTFLFRFRFAILVAQTMTQSLRTLRVAALDTALDDVDEHVVNYRHCPDS